VTDSESASIGGISRLWRFGQAEQSGDHRLHLLFGRGADSGHRLFDLRGGVLVHGEARLRGCRQGDTRRLSDRHRSLDVGVEEEAFDRYHLGLVLGDHSSEISPQLREALCVGYAGGGSYRSHQPVSQAAIPALDDGNPGGCETRIDP
jgi:hypothetical protein